MSTCKLPNLFVALSISMMGGTAYASTVQIENGSFEQPGTFTGTFQTLAAGSTGITGWTVGGAGVDHIRTYWEAADGGYSLDMNAADPGTISQQVDNLLVGEIYTVTFEMAANPDRGPAIKQLEASIDGFSGVFEADGTGRTRTDMGWSERSFKFLATSSSELLTFGGVGAGAWGATLDNISIAQTSNVPVPGSLLLFGTALGALGVARSRRPKR